MSIDQNPDHLEEDEYDEEADSDFNEDHAADGEVSSDSDEEEDKTKRSNVHSKRVESKSSTQRDDTVAELDSGDEATIKERKRAVRKQKKRGEDVHSDSDDGGSTWRAKTRSMRERENDDRKRSRLANIEGSTIDVEKAWAEMNSLGPLPPIRPQVAENSTASLIKSQNVSTGANSDLGPGAADEETITIKRKFKFAGEVHVEEKQVPKSSAEARLWLAQQSADPQPVNDGQVVSQRPLRKVSRFDPNYNNLDAFKTTWARSANEVEPFKGPKLNVVEKSKMDWASHVDAAGLKDELDEHAKAKEGYHGRMDFLSQVEQRREEDARQARARP